MYILKKNPYTLFLKQLRDVLSIENCNIVFNKDLGLDQCVYNLLFASQVATILMESDEQEVDSNCHILMYT